MEGQTLSEKSEKMIEAILESYKEYPVTVRMDTENIVNKNVLIQVLEELRRILFPGFFDTNRVRSEYIKYLVGDRMEFVQYHLRKQIARVLGNDETCDQCPKSDLSNKAEKIVEEFFSKIPMIREYLYTDVQAAYDGDPAAYSTDEVIFSYPGIFAITVYRIAHELVLLGVPLIPRIMTEYAHSLTGIDINPGAAIGKYFVYSGDSSAYGRRNVYLRRSVHGIHHRGFIFFFRHIERYLDLKFVVRVRAAAFNGFGNHYVAVRALFVIIVYIPRFTCIRFCIYLFNVQRRKSVSFRYNGIYLLYGDPYV